MTLVSVLFLHLFRHFPAVYTLPEFPNYIQQALDSRDKVCREDNFRKKIVRILFDDLLQYGEYVQFLCAFVT